MSRRNSRYPLAVEHAAPGKLVRTRTRQKAAPTRMVGVQAKPQTAADDALLYLGRTLLPLPGTLKRQGSYTIQAGDRIDNVAAKLLGDPLLYWMLMEANGASDPDTLCAVPGRNIIVPAAVGQGADPFDQPQASTRSIAAAPAAQTDDSEEGP